MDAIKKELKNKHQKEYRAGNKKVISLYNKKYNLGHKKEIKELSKNNYLLNKNKILLRHKNNYLKNKSKIIKRIAKYYAKKYCSNGEFRSKENIRRLVNYSLKIQGQTKNGSKWESVLGYSFGVVKTYLEKQFDSKMSWDNFGVYWELDHIIPLSWFKTYEQLIRRGWALNNLQPLEKNLNREKNNFYVGNPKTNLDVIYLGGGC
jgi:hypothetical protein